MRWEIRYAVQVRVKKKIQLQDRLVIHLLINIDDLVPNDITLTYNYGNQLPLIDS